MKSTRNDDFTPEKEELKFPVLMECIDTDKKFVVMFTDFDNGVVVNSQNPYRPIGFSPKDLAGNWVKPNHTKYWKKYTGQIILQND